MNERIQELAAQARVYANDQVREFTPEFMMFYTEKFAELLLLECINMMEEQKEYYSKPGSYESREYYERCEAKEDAYDDAASSIRYRFGIKK